MPNNGDKWTKWWWLGCFGLRTWTLEERKVRLALGMTAIVVFLMIDFPLAALLNFGIRPDYAAVLSAAISIVLAAFAARPVAGKLFPGALHRADKNSRRRLRRRATPPTSFQSRRLVRSTGLRFNSNVLTSVFAGTSIGLAIFFVLLVPVVPIALSLDTHVRQRAENAVWESASGHSRPFAGPFSLVDVRLATKEPI